MKEETEEEQNRRYRRNWVRDDVLKMQEPRILVGFRLVESEKGAEWNGKRVTWQVLTDLPEDELFDAPWHFSSWMAWDTLEEQERRNKEFQSTLEIGKLYKGFKPDSQKLFGGKTWAQLEIEYPGRFLRNSKANDDTVIPWPEK